MREAVKELFLKVFKKYPAITSANDLRDFAHEEEEGSENLLKPTFKEAREFLEDQGRSQVFKELGQKAEWASRIRKPLRPKVSWAMADLDWRTRTPLPEHEGYAEQKGYKFVFCMKKRAIFIFKKPFCTYQKCFVCKKGGPF